MSYKTARLKLKGYPVCYKGVAGELNNAISSLRKANFDIKNSLLEKIGRAVSPLVEHLMDAPAKDNYAWFGSLVYPVGKAKVAILFPWVLNWDNRATHSDTSVGVYSTKKVGQKKLKSLLEEIASQVKIFCATNLPYATNIYCSSH